MIEVTHEINSVLHQAKALTKDMADPKEVRARILGYAYAIAVVDAGIDQDDAVEEIEVHFANLVNVDLDKLVGAH